MEKANKILVDYGTRMKIFNAGLGSRPTIARALNGKADTPQAIRIREMALELGGVEMNQPNTQSNESATGTNACTPIV